VGGGNGLMCGGDGKVNVGMVSGHGNINVGLEYNDAVIKAGVLPSGGNINIIVLGIIAAANADMLRAEANINIGLPRANAAGDAAPRSPVTRPRAGLPWPTGRPPLGRGFPGWAGCRSLRPGIHRKPRQAGLLWGK
jgi:hypothetical protein